MKLLLSLPALLLAAILLAGAVTPTNDVPISTPFVFQPYTNPATSWGDYFPLEIQSTGQIVFAFSRPLTNHYSNLLAVLSITPLTNHCALCGEQHHEQHVCHYEVWDTLTVEIVCQGQTSTPQVWMGPKESRVVTQTVARTHSVAPVQQWLPWTNLNNLVLTNAINLRTITSR